MWASFPSPRRVVSRAWCRPAGGASPLLRRSLEGGVEPPLPCTRNHSQPVRKPNCKSTTNPLSDWEPLRMVFRRRGGDLSEGFRDPSRWHPWKAVPYSPLAPIGRVPDRCRNRAVVGAVERVRNPVENVPPKGCRNAAGEVGGGCRRSGAGKASGRGVKCALVVAFQRVGSVAVGRRKPPAVWGR
jgi:hypothetical protein